VISKIETIAIAQPIRQKFKIFIPWLFAIEIETKKVIDPNSEDNPKTCRKITAIETEFEEEKSIPVSGKYRVQPAAKPSAYEIEIIKI